MSILMDIKKFVEDNGLLGFPVGLGGCRSLEMSFDSCNYDLYIFDGKSDPDIVIKCDGEFVAIHHASLSETRSERLLQYDKLEIICDESWDLQMMLSKIRQKHESLFYDHAKNSLIESQFCSQKTIEAIKTGDAFASCWQKCATYHMTDAILSANYQRHSSSHMLDLIRKLEKCTINEHVSVITQTVGIERATPTLLERMLKSTVGFSDVVKDSGHSEIIEQKHDFFVKNSMLSDCYFYLGYLNYRNFVRIKDISKRPDLIHILKVAFDVEADSNLLKQHIDLIQKSNSTILEALSQVRSVLGSRTNLLK